jgi:SprT-like family protein
MRCRVRRLFLCACVAASASCGLGTKPAAPALSPAEAKQDEILREDIERPGDERLVAAYRAINARHFAGALAAMPVVWEPRLAEVGAMSTPPFVLEGMFGHVGRRTTILLNPALQNDAGAIDRALCHEMVHAYLFSTGNENTTHGPAFQAVLRRLAGEGAFEGIAATDEERQTLRGWLVAERVRLAAEDKDILRLDADLARERAEIEHNAAAYNARARRAGAGDDLRPFEREGRAINDSRDAYNQRAADLNARVDRGRSDRDVFNREVARYNLMLTYPDGIAADRADALLSSAAPAADPGQGRP